MINWIGANPHVDMYLKQYTFVDIFLGWETGFGIPSVTQPILTITGGQRSILILGKIEFQQGTEDTFA